MGEKESRNEPLSSFLCVTQDLSECLDLKEEPLSDSGDQATTVFMTVPSQHHGEMAAQGNDEELHEFTPCSGDDSNANFGHEFSSLLDTAILTHVTEQGGLSTSTDCHDALLSTLTSLDDQQLHFLSVGNKTNTTTITTTTNNNNTVVHSEIHLTTAATSSLQQNISTPRSDFIAVGPSIGNFSIRPSCQTHSPFPGKAWLPHSNHSHRASSNSPVYQKADLCPNICQPPSPSRLPYYATTPRPVTSSRGSNPNLPAMQHSVQPRPNHCSNRSSLSPPQGTNSQHSLHCPSQDLNSFSYQDALQRLDKPCPSPCLSNHSQSQGQGNKSTNDVADNNNLSAIVGSARSVRCSGNGNTSPRVSNGSESDDASSSPLVSSLSHAQSYASLTPWTSKLASENYLPLEPPCNDSLPIPFDISRDSMVLLSPRPGDAGAVMAESSKEHKAFSRLQPISGFNTPDNRLDDSSYGNAHSLDGNSYDNAHSTTRVQTRNTTSQLEHAQESNCNDSSDMSCEQAVLRSNYKVLPNKERRFRRTADALQKSGLWEVAMKTGHLMKRNRELQKELEQFRTDALSFLKSVIKNPENRDFIKNILNNALGANANHAKTVSPVMTVVASAAAAAACASVKLDSAGSTDASSMSGNASDSTTTSSSSSRFGENSPEPNYFVPRQGHSAIIPMDID